MKSSLFFISIVLSAFLLISADITPQEKYINQYAQVAVSEMYRSGVPASITLAQGILESRYGLSELATKGNNHFGIKCHSDWKGKTMKVDDDRKGECFRVYQSAEESFRDHSDFLRYSQRYQSLFDLDTKDYKGWANGLKKAGYATDPQYPAKLIKNIEDYNLDRFDSMKPSDFGRKAETSEQVAETIPESPSRLEEVEVYTSSGGKENFHFSLTRKVYSQNGVPFVYSVEGDTYAGLAKANDLFLREILKFNDLHKSENLLPGTVVYLGPKKKQAKRGLDKYIVGTDGESLRDICQQYAVRMKNVEKMNGFVSGRTLREGDTIILRNNGKEKK